MKSHLASLATSPPPPSVVLYVDHAGHPAPLGMCYHATASRVLSSSIDDRSPPSTSTEIDSAYCPQCLEFHDAVTASGTELRGTCPRPTCRACPVCGAALGVTIGPAADGGVEGEEGGSVCMYSCGYCRWTSEGCSVKAKVTAKDDGSIDKEEAARATEALLKSLTERANNTGGAEAEDMFGRMVKGWGKRAQDEERRRRQGDTSTVVSRRGGIDGQEGWSVEALEDNIANRRAQASKAFAETDLGLDLNRLTKGSAETNEKDSNVSSKSQNRRLTARESNSQMLVRPSRVNSEPELLPLPIPLRARKSRRCNAELAAGRPGILVKPKVNPLEGDSSLRSGHGQWWKKDSSAIHSVPKVLAVSHGLAAAAENAPDRYALLLLVQNPTLGQVRLRFSKSDLTLSPDALENVRVDAIDSSRVSACWDGAATSGLNPTDVIVLEPAQDAFLEIGKGQGLEPAEVTNWNPAEKLPSTVYSSLNIIASQEDKTWVEFILADGRTEGDDEGNDTPSASHAATSLSLQIEIGEGSWESSLIKPMPKEEDKPDSVSLDLVVMWELRSANQRK